MNTSLIKAICLLIAIFSFSACQPDSKNIIKKPAGISPHEAVSSAKVDVIKIGMKFSDAVKVIKQYYPKMKTKLYHQKLHYKSYHIILNDLPDMPVIAINCAKNKITSVGLLLPVKNIKFDSNGVPIENMNGFKVGYIIDSKKNPNAIGFYNSVKRYAFDYYLCILRKGKPLASTYSIVLDKSPIDYIKTKNATIHNPCLEGRKIIGIYKFIRLFGRKLFIKDGNFYADKKCQYRIDGNFLLYDSNGNPFTMK